MNPDLDLFYQEIGQLALTVASETANKIMVYAEVEDGLVSSDIFYAEPDADVVEFRLSPPVMEEVIQALWDVTHAEDPDKAWRMMTYVIENDSFKVELKTIDQIDEHADLSELRPAAVAEQFGDRIVDYSNPGV